MTLWKKMIGSITSLPKAKKPSASEGKASPGQQGPPSREKLTATKIESLQNQIRSFQELLAAKENDPTTLYKLAETWMTLGRFGEAIKPLKALLRNEPDHPSALFHLAECQLEMGRDDDAVDTLEHARQINPESAAILWQLARAHTNLCVTLGKLNRLEESVVHFRKAIELVPSFGPAHLAMGLTFFQQGQYHKAIDKFNETIEMDPDLTVDAYHHLARAYAKQGKNRRALQYFKDAIQVNPKAAVVHQDMGDFLFRQGKYEEAVTAFQNALKMSPKLTSDAWYKLGIAQIKLNRIREAEEPLREAFELTPDNIQVQDALTEVLYRVHQFWRKEGEPLKSLDLLREAVRINPTHAKAQLALAVLYDMNEEGKKAIRHLLFAKNFFLDQKNKEGLAQSVKLLQEYYPKYKMKPEDFEKLVYPSRHP